MSSFTKPVLCLVALSLMVLVGCQRLNVERTVQVNPGEVQDVIIDAPKSQQKINVAVTATGAAVDVYVVLDAEQKAVKDSLLMGKRPDTSKVLASQEKVENATLEATVPAKNEFRIVLGGAKKPAEVKVKVTSR